jgi:CheY-specific phosphatase CheX
MDESRELSEEFSIESGENLARLDQEFVQLEQRPSDRELLSSIFRTIHTIKGTCGFLGFSTLEAITHRDENILSELSEGLHMETYRPPAVRAVGEVFRTMMDTETWALAKPPSPLPDHPIVGAVYLAGGLGGAMLLETWAEQAWTQKLMSVPPPQSFDDDVRDCIGELAGMIAGNLKSMFPAETELSRPSVVEGRQFMIRPIGGHQKIKVDFASPDGPFSITRVQLSDG